MTQITINSQIGSALMRIMNDDVQPGSNLDYQLAKDIYLYHPLGQKMAESPISAAQSQPREITIQDAPDEVIKAFLEEQTKIGTDQHVHNVMRLSRVYGLASMILGCEGKPSTASLNMWDLWQLPVFINELDPLNTAGSLVLNQVPTASDFNKPVRVVTNGQEFHRSRYQVVMNEQPVYISYTASAFGFVGRSVYQRALYPLKSFIRTMVADDMIAAKLGLLISKQKSPGAVIDKFMLAVSAIKRQLIKWGITGQVLSIGTDEEIETLNMQNVDGAGEYSRTNILKNVATAADMPAKLLENETMVAGFGEGTEDAKNIARYIERFRTLMNPIYAWIDNIVMYRAWNPVLYKTIQAKYPELYGKMTLEEAFSQWRANFKAAWPSFLIEPDSELVKVEDVKLQAIVAAVQTLLPEVDPANAVAVIEWLADNIGENHHLFKHELNLDLDSLLEWREEQAERQAQLQDQSAEQPADGEARKFAKFDSQRQALKRLTDAVARLPSRRPSQQVATIAGRA